MNRAVNDLQVKVLRWIADDCPADEAPTRDFTYKTSAYALQRRGLATVDRRDGQWRAKITDAGRHYLEHGTYPSGGTLSRLPVKPVSASRRPASVTATDSASRSGELFPAAETARGVVERQAGDSKPAGIGLPVAGQIRKPHPAIRELVDHPKRVDLSAEIRRRVHLISHTLVQEALRKGWKVIAVKSEMRDRWPSGCERWWPSSDLFRIDAGERVVGVQFRLKTTRAEHVDTPEEARKRARGEHVWAPRWDYHPTVNLRLFLYHDTHSGASWEATARIPVENRLTAVLDRIEESTKSVITQREAERKRWEEQQRRLDEERRQRQRVVYYDAWLNALESLRLRWRQHAELTAFVDELQTRRDCIGEDLRDQFDVFMTWAHIHLEASSPFHGLEFPSEVSPDMTYEEWRRSKAHIEKQERRAELPWHLR